MTITLQEDLAFILLRKIQGLAPAEPLTLSETDLAGRNVTQNDILGHLDYLNQKQYIQAEFTGNAYARQEDVPDVVDADAVDFRVANTLGAEDGPLPHRIQFKKAYLTQAGLDLLKEMESNPPDALKTGPTNPIVSARTSFLEKVMIRGQLEDIYDARDISEVVFRTLRDLISTELADQVAAELGDKPAIANTGDKALDTKLIDLWQDTNLLVGFLSRIRAPLEFDAETFLFRIRQEAGLQRGVSPESITTAIFAALRDELSQDTRLAIQAALPDGMRLMWRDA